MKLFYTLLLIFVVLLIICLYQKDMFEGDTNAVNIINFNCSAQSSTQLITPNPIYCSNPKACLRYRSSLTPMPS
jgi:hypothetical protein